MILAVASFRLISSKVSKLRIILLPISYFMNLQTIGSRRNNTQQVELNPQPLGHKATVLKSLTPTLQWLVQRLFELIYDKTKRLLKELAFLTEVMATRTIPFYVEPLTWITRRVTRATLNALILPNGSFYSRKTLRKTTPCPSTLTVTSQRLSHKFFSS